MKAEGTWGEREGDFPDNFSVKFANREHDCDELTTLIWVIWPCVCMYVCI